MVLVLLFSRCAQELHTVSVLPWLSVSEDESRFPGFRKKVVISSYWNSFTGEWFGHGLASVGSSRGGGWSENGQRFLM